MNTTNSTKTLSATEILNTIDILFRCLFLSTHVVYFVIVFLFKEFHKLSYFNMHHSNFIGLALSILYCSWIGETQSNIQDFALREIFCTISEISWALFRTARAYSILALAVYRYLAVHDGKTFTKISKSRSYYLMTGLLVWLIPLMIFVIFKFSFHTTHGLLCLDGFTIVLTDSIIYYVFTTTLGLLVPIILVVIAYILVHSRLYEIRQTLSKCSSESQAKKKASKENKLAKQFILLVFFEILSTLFWILINVSSWIPNFNNNYYYLRQIWRTLNNFSQGLIPIISLVLNPTKLKLKGIKNFRFKIETVTTIDLRKTMS